MSQTNQTIKSKTYTTIYGTIMYTTTYFFTESGIKMVNIRTPLTVEPSFSIYGA